MDQEAPDELAGGERHVVLTFGAFAAVVFVAEGHPVSSDGDEAVVRDGDAMGVARQIGEYRLRAREWRLA